MTSDSAVPQPLPAGGEPPRVADPDFMRSETSPKVRLGLYAALVLLLVGAAPFVARTQWHGGAGVHTQIETAATLLALVIGVLSLVRFYGRKDGPYLFIGTGFLATGLLEGAHTLLTSPLVPAPDAQVAELGARSWLVARVFLALFLGGSWAVWYQEQKEGARHRLNEDSVYWTTAVLVVVALVVLAALALDPVSQVYLPDARVSNPFELLPAALFLVALLGYLAKGRWRVDTFEHWLVIALAISTALHLAYLPFSSAPHDALSGWGHLLKLASYGAIMVGLVGSVSAAFRQEEIASGEIAKANLALAHEVSIRSATEQVLHESEQGLRDFLDHANDMVQSTDREGRLIYANQAWKRAMGFADQDIEGLDTYTLLQPEDWQRWRDYHTTVFDGGSVAGMKVALSTSDGGEIICTGNANRRMEKGEPVAMLTILRNVTEELAAEEELAASRANLKALFESTGDPIWSVGTDHALITFNTAFALTVEAMTGREPEVGDAVPVVVRPDEVEWFQERYDRALSGRRFSDVRTEHVDDQTRSYELFFNPIATLSGIWGVVVFSKDVTPRKLIEEALRLAKEEAEEGNQAKSQFLANMSHELRTPLNSVIGFANILIKNRGGQLEKTEKGYLDRILANGKHLLTLINEILDLSKIEAGKMEVELQSVDLGALVRETLGQMEAQVGSRPVHLELEAPETMAQLQTDAGKLKQVVINLIGNALKFTEEGSVTVRIEVDPESGEPRRLAVRDTGVGIPEERLNAIFEAFQQADGSTTRRFGGTGLGLTISRSICHLLGYELSVESEVDKGSTFTIHMPPREGVEEVDGADVGASGDPDRAAGDAKDGDAGEGAAPRPGGVGVDTEGKDEAGKTKAAKPAAGQTTAEGREPRRSGSTSGKVRDRASGGTPVGPPGTEGGLAGSGPREPVDDAVAHRLAGRTILVIDDEHDSRFLLSHYLEDAGCRIVMARDGEEGLEVARAHRPEAITLDLMMPGMSGWKFLEAIRKDPELCHIPVVVVSIVAEDGGRFPGAVELLAKPIERDRLLDVLTQHIRRMPGKVLVVEDDDDARTVVREYLMDAGIHVREAVNGQEALDALEDFDPDLVLLDLMMPVMDGVSFLNRLRTMPAHLDLPVVVLTAKSLSAEETRNLRLKASGVIPKGDALEERLKTALDGIFKNDGLADPRRSLQ